MATGGHVNAISGAGAPAEAVVQAFFGPHNDANASDAVPFVELLRTRGATVLPHQCGALTRWYGFALRERLARELRAHLLAFVGPSWSTWTGPASSLDLADPVEGALLASARGPVFRITPVAGGDADLQQALVRMASTLQTRPLLARNEDRPRHRVLSELLLAFVAHNDERAATLIDELVAMGTLSAINVLFLDIRRLDARDDVRAILDHPALFDLLRRRRPRAVGVAIARAVYAVHLAPLEAQWYAGDTVAAATAREVFGNLPADFQTVFGDRLLPDTADMLTSRVLHHVLRDERHDAHALVSAADTATRPWLLALIDEPGADRPGPSPAPPTAEARPENPDEIIGVLLNAPLDAASADRAVRLAYTLDTQESALAVIAALNHADALVLDEARRDKLFRVAERDLRGVVASSGADAAPDSDLVARPPVATWEHWFTRLANDGPWEDCLSIVQRAVTEWDADVLADSAEVHKLASAMARCANDERSHDAAVGGVAQLVNWLAQDHGAVDVAPVLDAALDLLLYAAEPGDVRDAVTVSLLERVLTHRQDQQTLSARLQELGDSWNDLPTPRRLDWALAVLDLAVDFGARSEPVMRFFGLVLAAIARWPERVDASQRATIASIARDLDASASITTLFAAEQNVDAPPPDPFAGLAGMTIGVYTLTTGVGERARAVVKATCPTAKVELNSDLVATARLRAIATRADVMVVVYQSAQHSATDAIVAVRGRDGVLPAQGKGTAGVLRALEHWLAAHDQNLQATAA